MMMKMIGTKWTYPEKSSVMEGEPFFSPNGKKLYFISRKSLENEDNGGKERIWCMDKTSTGWSKAKPLDETVNAMRIHWQFTVDKWDNLFFSGSNKIFRAENKEGKYGKPVDISELYNNKTLKGFCPFISPDGSYIIFSSTKKEGGRNIDLFVSFKRNDGTWTNRINLGEDINATGHDIGPVVTLDGKYLFFTSVGKNRPWGIYWVDARILEKLKSEK
jgi:Tol biopolymer transport system component